MLMWASKNERVVIDAGILFPQEECFDINYLIPDYSELDAPTDLIITHGHEDHLGAVVHAVERFPDIRVWAPPFAAGILRKKFAFDKIKHRVFTYEENKIWDFEGWEIHPIHVNHSIPQTYGVLLLDKERQFCALHISDFKCNLKDGFEPKIDFAKIERLTQGVPERFLFADSTSILSKSEKTPDEASLIPSFEKIISEAPGRVYFTLFSSNIERIQNILDATLKDDRKLVPYGRSMNFYMEIAEELGILKDFQLAYKNPDSMEEETKNVVILVSGCQGDFKSTFRRIAYAEEGTLKPQPGDTFVLSSRAIPGNEKKVAQVISKLYEQGCKVFTADNAHVHVSGHAGREDVLILARAFNPTHFVPIHGDSAFLFEHVSWMKEHFSELKTEILYNHHILSLMNDGRVLITQQDGPKPIMIHGRNIPIEPEAISERRKLATTGLIFVSIKMDTLKNHKAKIEVDFLGLPQAFIHKDRLETFLQVFVKENKIRDQEKYKEDMRVSVRRFFEGGLGYKPVVMIHLV